MASKGGGWSQWLRNGRLATIALAIVFVAWLGFQVFAATKPPVLDQVLLYTVGLWFGNVAMETRRRDDDAADSAAEVEGRVGRLERESDERGERDD